MLSPFWSEYI